MRAIPTLKKLDNIDVTPEELSDALSSVSLKQQEEEEVYENPYNGGQNQQQQQQTQQQQWRNNSPIRDVSRT